MHVLLLLVKPIRKQFGPIVKYGSSSTHATYV